MVTGVVLLLLLLGPIRDKRHLSVRLSVPLSTGRIITIQFNKIKPKMTDKASPRGAATFGPVACFVMGRTDAY